MKKLILLLFPILAMTGCTTTIHTTISNNDGEVNPDYYTEITPISVSEEDRAEGCNLMEFLDPKMKNFDNVIDIRAVQTQTIMGFGMLTISNKYNCEYRAFGVKYKDAGKIKKKASKSKPAKSKSKKKGRMSDDEEEEEDYSEEDE